MQKSIFSIALIVLFSLGIEGCASGFKISPSDKTALVRVHRKVHYGGYLKLCEANKEYVSRIPSGDHYIEIPANKRINIGLSTDLLGGRGVFGMDQPFSCTQFISFVPQAGMRYIVDAKTDGKSCETELVREDANSEFGLRLEESIGEPSCTRD